MRRRKRQCGKEWQRRRKRKRQGNRKNRGSTIKRPIEDQRLFKAIIAAYRQESSAADNASARIRDAAGKPHAALASNDYKSAASLFTADAIYEDMTLRTQVLGRLAIERYLSRALATLPAGVGSSLLHVVGGDKGGGYEWQAAPAYRTTVRRGITGLALDQDGKISSLTTVWDGAMLPDAEIRGLMTLSLD